MSDSASVKSELRDLRQQIRLQRAKIELKQLQAAAGMSIFESHGDSVNDPEMRTLYEDAPPGGFVDSRDFVSDDPAFSYGGPASLYSLLSDRQWGKYWPVYQHEIDLMRIRGSCHNLRLLCGTLDGLQDSLANYVLGKGFTFLAQPAEKAAGIFGDSDLLIAAVQRCIDRFIDDHGFDGSGFDRECHHRSREDGEAFAPIEWDPRRGRVKARFLECEQVTQPASTNSLDNWLGFRTEFPTDWSFGVHTTHRRTNEVHGYHVVYDGIQGDWSYFPDFDVPDPVMQDAKEMGSGPVARLEHIKRNVPANAKRGVSDYFPVIGDMGREAKIRRNTAEGAALQAAIAWILQPTIPGGSQSGAQGIGSGDFFTNYQKPIANSGTKLQNVTRYVPGTILRAGYGYEYKPGPMGAERNQGFVDVGQYVLRMTGMRWQFPEGMISGDYSNNNFASSMVAESPFVKAREADQVFYKRHFHSLIWKVLRMCWEMGAFDRFGISWASLEHLVDVKIDCPTVATRDALKMAQTAQLYKALGVLSLPTIASQAGLDYEAEKKLGAKPDETVNPPASGALPGELDKTLKGADGKPQPARADDQKPPIGAQTGPQIRPGQPQMQEGETARPHAWVGGPQPGDNLRPAMRTALREAVLTARSVEEAQALVLDAVS